MKSKFDSKWKRRKNDINFWWKFSIFIGLYFNLYKKEYTQDNKWHYRTYRFFTKDEYNCLQCSFNSHDVKDCKRTFKHTLLEMWHRKQIWDDKALFIKEVVMDFISDCQGYDDLVTGIHYLRIDDKIIEGLNKRIEYENKNKI